jgi:LmbE family N-acetylglucosaminyl deacetylase
MTDAFEGPVIVVGAHPDDPEFGAGGTIARFTRNGQAVHYVVCTDGSRGTKDRTADSMELARTRAREQRAAADALGVGNIFFFNQSDGSLTVTMELRRNLARIIRQIRPRLLITHDPWRLYQLHPDHRAAGFLTTDAFVAARDHLYHPELFYDEKLEPFDVSEIWFYGPAEIDHFVDISQTLEQKVEAVLRHASQLRDPAGTAERLRARAAETGQRHGVPAAEEFKRLRIA